MAIGSKSTIMQMRITVKQRL